MFFIDFSRVPRVRGTRGLLRNHLYYLYLYRLYGLYFLRHLSSVTLIHRQRFQLSGAKIQYMLYLLSVSVSFLKVSCDFLTFWKCAAVPLPSARPLGTLCLQRRGGAGGGVCIFLLLKKLLTPPLPLPYKGGEGHAAGSAVVADYLKWIQLITLFHITFRPFRNPKSTEI